jgi:hypothetical protein
MYVCRKHKVGCRRQLLAPVAQLCDRFNYNRCVSLCSEQYQIDKQRGTGAEYNLVVTFCHSADSGTFCVCVTDVIKKQQQPPRKYTGGAVIDSFPSHFTTLSSQVDNYWYDKFYSSGKQTIPQVHYLCYRYTCMYVQNN